MLWPSSADLLMEEEHPQGHSRAKKQANACANYLEGRSRKVHKLRDDLEQGLRADQANERHTTCAHPVNQLLKSCYLFLSPS